MAIRVKSLEDMTREITATLKAGRTGQPAYTLLVGSGFSFPVIPTSTQMVTGDIAWWRFWKESRISEITSDPSFPYRADAVAKRFVQEQAIAAFERNLWKQVRSEVEAFPLTDQGIPDLTDPTSVGLAYQAVMSHGLFTNRMRREYLRDTIRRSHPKVNGAHIFLGGILAAQDSWGWGAPFCRTIFTTNFDPLLQRSLQLVNKLYYMTDRPDALESVEDDDSDAIHLIYTHGSAHRYKLLNTEDQIDQARERNSSNLVDYFERHGVIVVGYSGWQDTTMEALLACASFDSNLYWCDIHPVAETERRLRPEVLTLLRAKAVNAYYVPISGADDAIRQLHRALELGDVPRFILEPVANVIAQMKSIAVPVDLALSGDADGNAPSGSMANLLTGALTRLEIAKAAFADPSIVRPSSDEETQERARALIAQRLSDAALAYSSGDPKRAIELWTAVLAADEALDRERGIARSNRGWVYASLGRTTDAQADLTAALAIADLPADARAHALVNRDS